MSELTILGSVVRQPIDRLEVFPCPSPHVTEVTFHTDEFTSMCPVTSQPDLSSVTVTYRPADVCVESKSLKLFLWGFRDRGVFCEGLADQIARRLWDDADPHSVTVIVNQRVRGGIVTTTTAKYERNSK